MSSGVTDVEVFTFVETDGPALDEVVEISAAELDCTVESCPEASEFVPEEADIMSSEVGVVGVAIISVPEFVLSETVFVLLSGDAVVVSLVFIFCVVISVPDASEIGLVAGVVPPKLHEAKRREVKTTAGRTKDIFDIIQNEVRI